MARCAGKARYASREFAEQMVVQHRERKDEHPIRGLSLQAYFCECGAWHIGHRREHWHKASTDQSDALGRLQHLRATLVESHGRTKDPREWQGVRVLTRVIAHVRAW